MSVTPRNRRERTFVSEDRPATATENTCILKPPTASLGYGRIANCLSVFALTFRACSGTSFACSLSFTFCFGLSFGRFTLCFGLLQLCFSLSFSCWPFCFGLSFSCFTLWLCFGFCLGCFLCLSFFTGLLLRLLLLLLSSSSSSSSASSHFPSPTPWPPRTLSCSR